MNARKSISVLKSISGYGLSTLVNGVLALVLIPVIVTQAGASAWGEVAIGQAIGLFVSVILGLGWTVSGPAIVASGTQGTRGPEFRKSLAAKTTVAIPILALILITQVINPEMTVVILSLATTGLSGLSASWYFIGLRRPYTIFALETLPKSIATVAAILLLLLLNITLETALLIILAGTTISIVIPSLVVLLSTPAGNPGRMGLRFGLAAVKGQSHDLTTSLLFTTFVACPVLIVGLVAAPQLPLFALADKLVKQILNAVAPVVSVAQSWAPRAGSRRERIDRTKRIFHLALFGVVGLFVALAALGRSLIELLSGGLFTPSTSVVFSVAALASLLFFERLFGRACLVPLEGSGALAKATGWGTVIGLVGVGLCAANWGVSGALLGMSVGVAVSILVQCMAWRERMHTEPLATVDSGRING